jgi:hypothetical protein
MELPEYDVGEPLESDVKELGQFSELSDGLRAARMGVRFPAVVREFYLLYSTYTGFGAYPASYAVNMGGDFPGGEGARIVKLITGHSPSSTEVKSSGTIPPLTHVHSLHSA